MATAIPVDEKGAVDENRGIIVLGMHRAGTSAVAHLLVDLGFELAGEPVPAAPDNPQGYWEPREVVDIHDQFLHAIGRTWSDPRPLAPHLFAGETAAEAGRRLREVVDRVVAPRRRWVVKDPRMCRLIPLWQEVLEAGIADLHFLHVLRSPLSVAGSLRERDGFSNEKSFLLWLRHCLEAEMATRGKDRTWLHFEQLTAFQPSALNQRLRAVTGSPRLPGKRLQGVVESILVPSLVHYRHEIDATLDGLRAYPWIARAYRALDLLGTDRDGEGRAGLDELRAEISSADALLLGEPLTWEAERHGERYVRLIREIERFHRSVEAQRREIGTQRNEVQAMHEAQRNEVQAVREAQRNEVQAMSEARRNEVQAMHEAQRNEAQAMREAQRNEAQAMREAFAESLGGLRQQLDAVAQAIAGERESLASISARTSAIEARISERLEKRHLTLLHKSLEATSRVEALWMSTRDQLEAMTTERDAALGECDRTAEERDAALRALEEAQAEGQKARADVESLHRTLADAQNEIHQLLRRKSWRVTAPLRWLYRTLKRALRR